jgi:hypothetical protein
MIWALLVGYVVLTIAVIVLGSKMLGLQRQLDLVHDRQLTASVPGPKVIENSPVCSCGGKWSKWSLADIDAQVSIPDRATLTGLRKEWKKFNGQRRSCEDCGFTEVRRLTT